MADHDYDKLVKYMAERLVRYLETPAEERKRLKRERAMAKPGWSYRWFGLLPLALAQWKLHLKNRKQARPKENRPFRTIRKGLFGKG